MKFSSYSAKNIGALILCGFLILTSAFATVGWRAKIVAAATLQTGCPEVPLSLARDFGASPAAGMASADFDRDGKLDLAISFYEIAPSLQPVVVRVFKGDVANGWSEMTSINLPADIGYSVGRNSPLVAADVNGDGNQDLVIVRSGANCGFSVYLNDGRGRFPAVAITAISARSNEAFTSFTTGDFNKDGRTDFVANREGQYSAYLGTADGRFARQQYDFGTAGSVLAADFNNDGNQDLFIAGNGSNRFAFLWYGDGKGNFVQGEYNGFNQWLMFFAAVDFNKDGRVDVLADVGNTLIGQYVVWLNIGNGRFQQTTITDNSFTEGIGGSRRVADVNGDGWPDVIGQGFISINNGQGGVCQTPVPQFQRLVQMITTDLNGDDRSEILVIYDPSARAQLLSPIIRSPNTPPTITAAPAQTVLQGAQNRGSVRYIPLATVRDDGTPTRDLRLAVSGVPAGVSIFDLHIVTGNNGEIVEQNLRSQIHVECDAQVEDFPITVTATDGGGLSSSAIWLLRIGEKRVPYFTNLPAPMTVGLGASLEFMRPVAWDAGGIPIPTSSVTITSATFQGQIVPSSSLSSLRIENATPVGTHTLTFTVTDRCGLQATGTTLLTVTGSINTPPKFETIASLTIDKGYELSSRIIGKVSDAETPPSQMKLEAVSIPTGITITRLDSSSGDVYATISADCAIRAGEYVVQLKATDGGGAIATANLKVIVRENAPMTAPIYQDLVITPLSNQSYVHPVILPTKNGAEALDTTNLKYAASSSDFPGTIEVRGFRVFFSNATKPGTYTINVTTSEKCGLEVKSSFKIIVQARNACPPPTFSSSPKYGTGSAPRAVAVGDFNNDQKVDLLVGNLGNTPGPDDGTVSLFLNNGNGTFGTATNFRLKDDLTANPRSVAVGDFNNDGNLDAAIGNGGVNAVNAIGSVILMLGNGKGGLTKATEASLGVTTVAAQLAVADFNKDGKLDVAAVETIGNRFVVFLGNGTGGLQPVSDIKLPPSSSFTIGTADFNKDGNADIAVAQGFWLTLSFGDGRGNFTAPKTSYWGFVEDARTLVIDDFNRDGNADVATTSDDRIVVKLGNGKGEFPLTTAYQLSEIPRSISPLLTVSDVNRDGFLDLTVIGRNSIITLTGDGRGGFCSPTTQTTDFSGEAIVAGDLNGDGLADLALTALSENGAYVFLNTTGKPSGCDTPVFNPALHYAANTRPYGLASGDFNGDGKVDLATTNLWDNTVTVLLADANGFTKQTPISVGVLPNYIAARDLNGDNKLDLAVVNRGSDAITILLGNGDGTFAKKGDYQVGNKSTGVAIGDFNNDGKLDLILPNDGLGNAVVLDGNGDGSFSALRYVFAGGSPQPGVVADFNKDGNADVAFPQYISGEVAILFGNGNGQFQSPIYIGNLGGTGVEAIALGDVNGDGNVDVAVTNTTTNQVFTIISDGRGGFTRGSSFATGSDYPASIVMADFTSDGNADITVGGYNNNRVHIFKGLGDGFDSNTPLVLAVGNEPLSLLTNDFNGDGKPDLAVANNGSGTVSVLLNGCGK